MAVKLFEKLSNNYLELLEDKEDFNVIIKVGESPNAKIFQAHSAILRHRSLYFRNELVNINKDKNNIKTLDLKNISNQQFEIVIKYIYGGVILLENHNASFIFELMLIAYEFLFDELAKYLETHLIETESHSHWLRLNFTRIYQKIFQNNKSQELQKWCNDIVVKYPDKIFESEDFFSLQDNALVSLISRDDLQMKEVKIWNHVIKWGIAQNSGLQSDPEDWSIENFLALKTTLRNCLPHIRYFQMSSDEFIDNVQPYQQILEKNLWKDITNKFMSPNRQVSSTILPPRVILTPKLPSRNTVPFSTVINEAHGDGFTKGSFWKLCDKQTNLVVVMKVKGTDEILGGYNPIGWDMLIGKEFYKRCDDSFIFSLKNYTIQASILSRVKQPEYAIKCSSGRCAPIFGGIGRKGDLVMFDNCNQDRKCYNRQISYEKRIRNEFTFNESGTSWADALRPKKRKRSEDNQSISIKKIAKMQQASDNIPVTEKENTPSLTQEPNQLTSTPQAGIILGLPTPDSHNRNNESWADEFEEVIRTTNNVSSESIMGNDKDSKNSPANAHEMRLSRENGYTNKHAENRATDLSDQAQPQLVSVQAMPTDASHMESYDTNTNLATHYINSSIQTTQANNPYEIKDSPSKDRRVNNQKTLDKPVCKINQGIGKDILGLKPHFTKGIRTHLGIIFKSYDNVQKNSTEGISLFNQTFLGYIPTNSRNSYLLVKLKNVPIDFQESITKEIKDTFEHVGKISSIKPLVFEGTSILSNQWVVIFDITNDPDITKRLPRFITIMDQKVTTEWREAPKLCFFCDAEGHIKRECQQYKEAQELKAAYSTYKNNNATLSKNSISYSLVETNNNNPTIMAQILENNNTNKQEQLNQEKTITPQIESTIQNI
ncbi:hypothetical protein C2G38_2168076 [Gigaspora rosea]|uniref:BTB domain-containing protein n=1 Tax=Gigaspora rosea TaxID=44941 RepID=A0A397VQ61_9GLOM|nr:hypothetical protein C2G38_2168076 [Gigaspora rosea]